MGLFNMHYDRPGPGVAPDAPRKKGFARLLELLGRDFGSYFKAGFLAFCSALPFIIFMVMAITTHAVIFIFPAGLLGGMLAMPQLCGMADTLLRSLRDEPGYWWQTYCRSWKRNVKATLLPGAVCGMVLATQIFTLFHLADLGTGPAFWVMLLVGIFLTFGLIIYLIAQLALVEMGLPGMLKNSALLLLGYLPRTAGAAAVNLVYWGAVLLFFPFSLLILAFTNFWVPLLLSLLIVYPPLEKSFDIEATIKAMREKELDTPAGSAPPAP